MARLFPRLPPRLGWAGFALLGASGFAALAWYHFVDLPRSDARLAEHRAREQALAAMWDGRCPHLDPDYAGRDRPSYMFYADVVANAARWRDAEAALCMAAYERDFGGGPFDPERYHWLVVASLLGADVDAELARAERALSPDVVAEERRMAEWRLGMPPGH